MRKVRYSPGASAKVAGVGSAILQLQSMASQQPLRPAQGLELVEMAPSSTGITDAGNKGSL